MNVRTTAHRALFTACRVRRAQTYTGISWFGGEFVLLFSLIIEEVDGPVCSGHSKLIVIRGPSYC